MPKTVRIVNVHLHVEMPEIDPSVRHDIQVGLELEVNRGIHVKGDLPTENRIGSRYQVRLEGHGDNVLGAVIDWFNAMNRSVEYVPAYREEEDRQEQELLKKQGLEKDDVPLE